MTAAPSSRPAAPLRVQRLPLAQILAAAGHDHAHAPFAALTYGVAGHEPWMTGVSAHVLLAEAPDTANVGILRFMTPRAQRDL